MKLDRIIAVRNNKTIYRDGDKCIKVFHEPYTKAEVLNEALNQARIEETELNVPKVWEVTCIDGKWAIVSEYIKGKTMTQLMKEHPEKKREYLELLADLQVKINAKVCPLLGRLKDKMDRHIKLAELDAVTRFDLHRRLEAMPKHDKVCHGDLTPSNVMITEDGTPYILDWSHATRGNAASDAAITCFYFRLHGDEESSDMYLDLYCEKSGTDRSYVHKWMPIVAASQSIKGTPKERELLRTWVNVIDED